MRTQRIKPDHVSCTQIHLCSHREQSRCHVISNWRKVQGFKRFQTMLSNYILYLLPGQIFITVSTAHTVFSNLPPSGSPSVKSVFSHFWQIIWQQECKELDFLYQRWWDGGFFNPPEQKIIYGFVTADVACFQLISVIITHHFDLYYIWLLGPVLCLCITDSGWFERLWFDKMWTGFFSSSKVVWKCSGAAQSCKRVPYS